MLPRGGCWGARPDVSLQVQPSECVAVVGGSGAGKSTLLRCLMGLQKPARPRSGTLSFQGNLTDLATARTSGPPPGMAFVPQNPDFGFDPLKRLRWQWRQCARLMTGRNEFTEAQRTLLTSFGLKDFGARFPHQWSRGMQQRLLLAMALLGAPKLLILDEPTSALDPLVAAQVLRKTMEVAEDRKIAILIVTHDIALASKYANRTAVMARGRVAEFGLTRDLFASPRTDYARQLVSHAHWGSTTVKSRSSLAAAE